MSGAEERELLEWAAKAAGYTGRVEFSGLTDECFFAFDADTAQRTGRATWNPRNDDGDSRRLEVALNIDVQFNTDNDEQTTSAIAPSPERPGSGEGRCFTEGWRDDKGLATRLAVLRAAAAIGKAMP